MSEFREMEYFQAFRHERLYYVTLSEADAWRKITTDDEYVEDPRGWSVQRRKSLIPTTRGQRVEGSGMMVFEEEVNGELREAPAVPYVAAKIF